MNGAALGGQPIAAAGLRREASELAGPRAAGVRDGATERMASEARTTRATRP